jgi:hypothetical protein
MVLILKSMPIVVMNEGVKESSLNLSRQHDLPTPLSPMRRSLIYDMRISLSGRNNATLNGIGQLEALLLGGVRLKMSLHLQKEHRKHTRKS